jgi:ABC-type branched-subunit amino acid transport system ATPase component
VTAAVEARVTTSGLRVEGLTVRYGAHVAVDDLTLEVPAGRLTGLIGPNGAGKTTTFNACSGLLGPAAGRVLLDGRDISRLGPAARARRGLGRTFQRMELFTSMTVAENLTVAGDASRAGANPLRQFFATRAERTGTDARVAAALERCGLADLADRNVGGLSTGQRRLVELARALVSDFCFLLLDEPSSGLDQRETAAFGAILRSLVDAGLGILLVEHDMSLVMEVCDHLYVLDFGQLIFEGDPEACQASATVRAAYLGMEA